jgi:peptidoglycan/LPS O-acetylase OafA/YrhL
MNLSNEESPRYMPELDGIRGLAILGVLCSHGASVTGLFDARPNSPADSLFKLFMVPLWGGVDLFFVLSGFLITGILLRTKTAENYFTSFYIRRMLRIFPIYYLALTSSLMVGHFLTSLSNELPPSSSWKFAYFIYLQNWPAFWHGEKIMGGVWGAYWSLAVEEQFYFIWPVVIFLLSERTIVRICIIGMICALPLRLFLSYDYFGNSFGLAQITSSRVDGLFAGGACAIYMFRNRRPVPMRWIIASASGGVAIIGYIALFHTVELVSTGKWITTIGITGFALLSASLVAVSQHHIPFVHRILTSNWLRTVGRYSYGIYVYHLFIFLLFRAYLMSSAGVRMHLNFPQRLVLLLSETVAVFVIAILSYDLFEARVLKMKKYFKPA